MAEELTADEELPHTGRPLWPGAELCEELGCPRCSLILQQHAKSGGGDGTCRRFQLHRDKDVTGFSGTGIVADGVRFPDGTAAMRWRGKHRSTVVWEDLADAMVVHGHDGATRLVWVDGGTS